MIYPNKQVMKLWLFFLLSSISSIQAEELHDHGALDQDRKSKLSRPATRSVPCKNGVCDDTDDSVFCKRKSLEGENDKNLSFALSQSVDLYKKRFAQGISLSKEKVQRAVQSSFFQEKISTLAESYATTRDHIHDLLAELLTDDEPLLLFDGVSCSQEKLKSLRISEKQLLVHAMMMPEKRPTAQKDNSSKSRSFFGGAKNNAHQASSSGYVKPSSKLENNSAPIQDTSSSVQQEAARSTTVEASLSSQAAETCKVEQQAVQTTVQVSVQPDVALKFNPYYKPTRSSYSSSSSSSSSDFYQNYDNSADIEKRQARERVAQEKIAQIRNTISQGYAFGFKHNEKDLKYLEYLQKEIEDFEKNEEKKAVTYNAVGFGVGAVFPPAAIFSVLFTIAGRLDCEWQKYLRDNLLDKMHKKQSEHELKIKQEIEQQEKLKAEQKIELEPLIVNPSFTRPIVNSTGSQSPASGTTTNNVAINILKKMLCNEIAQSLLAGGVGSDISDYVSFGCHDDEKENSDIYKNFEDQFLVFYSTAAGAFAGSSGFVLSPYKFGVSQQAGLPSQNVNNPHTGYFFRLQVTGQVNQNNSGFPSFSQAPQRPTYQYDAEASRQIQDALLADLHAGINRLYCQGGEFKQFLTPDIICTIQPAGGKYKDDRIITLYNSTGEGLKEIFIPGNPHMALRQVPTSDGDMKKYYTYRELCDKAEEKYNKLKHEFDKNTEKAKSNSTQIEAALSKNKVERRDDMLPLQGQGLMYKPLFTQDGKFLRDAKGSYIAEDGKLWSFDTKTEKFVVKDIQGNTFRVDAVHQTQKVENDVPQGCRYPKSEDQKPIILETPAATQDKPEQQGCGGRNKDLDKTDTAHDPVPTLQDIKGENQGCGAPVKTPEEIQAELIMQAGTKEHLLPDKGFAFEPKKTKDGKLLRDEKGRYIDKHGNKWKWVESDREWDVTDKSEKGHFNVNSEGKQTHRGKHKDAKSDTSKSVRDSKDNKETK